MKAVLIILFAFFTSVNIMAVNGTPDETNNKKVFSGKIIDENTGEPLSGVKVMVQGTDNFAYTDLDGNFSLEATKNNAITIEITYISYKSKVTWLNWNQAVQSSLTFMIQPE